MNKETRKHYQRVASLGCIICQGIPEIHHIREGTGLALKSKEVIPLCHRHHRTGGCGVAFHAGKEGFEKNFGTQEELLRKVEFLLLDDKNILY